MSNWTDVIQLVDIWRSEWEQPARSLQKSAFLLSQSPYGIWLNPEANVVAVFAQDLFDRAGLEKLATSETNLPLADLNSAITPSQDPWIKLAELRPLRIAGELLNVFPSTTGIPNAPSPLAAMLTSAVVGGGIGYGGGAIAEHLSPVKLHPKRLRRTAAILGALTGAGVITPWALDNYSQKGLPGLLDPSPFDDRGRAETGIDRMYDRVVKKAAASLFPQALGRTPTSVDVNALGQTVWASGASPQLTAATMGTVYAASQFPDLDAEPGTVTGHQFGQLAVQAGTDYIVGRLGGAILNRLTGIPITGHQAGVGLATINTLSTVIPRMLGAK